MQYCLDANIFIEAKNRHYQFDICPGFWDLLDLRKGTIGSVIPVFEELDSGNDELKNWVSARKKTGLFADISDFDVQESFRVIAAHVSSQYQTQYAQPFLDGADPWLIAYAKINDCTVVTGEVISHGAKKVKIPNICEEFGVTYIDCFTMLKSLNVRFVLDF